MDSLIENLYSSFKVDENPNNTAAAHPYFSAYYKCKNDSSNQAARRKEFLEAQKEKRNSLHNSGRNLLELEKCDSMEWSISNSKGVAHKTKADYSKEIRNILMESEWLVDIPEDLNISWTAVVCPQGKRCVLVAQGKTTSAFDKTGHRFLSFPSWLPSGSGAEVKLSQGAHHRRTILDCIYCFTSKTFFILDVIEWNSHSFFNCDTNFRFYWLPSKIEEIKRLSEKSKVNPYAIRLAPRFPVADLESKMAHYPMLEETDPKVDGILFYHNETHYTSGSTPLVGWLKPFMVPEMLNIIVHVVYQFDVPPNYQTALDYIQSSLATSQKHKAKGQAKESSSQKERKSKKSSNPSKKNVIESMEEDTNPSQESSSGLPGSCDNSNNESMDDQPCPLTVSEQSSPKGKIESMEDTSKNPSKYYNDGNLS